MQKVTRMIGNDAAFGGLWLCPDVIVQERAFFRSAILFLEGQQKHYKLRFNHDAIEGGMTMEFLWDYHVTPIILYEHPLNYPESIQIEMPWRRGEDGSLMLQFDDGWERFKAATFEQLFSAGFEEEVVKEVLEELQKEGWKYELEARFPSFS